ncbi:hypothetical protein IPH25_04150 [bacterium]|nr:MAG: hypothetical protein IPG37_01145 [bacterium]QQR61639.1 MAG: hypothetical protein IPH25_04150 [bacterium]
MNKKFSCIPILVLTLLLTHSPDIYGAQLWNGTPFDVTDQDINVTGGNQTFSTGHTYVTAVNNDISIDISSPTIFEGNPSGRSILHLIANEGHTITIHVNDNLTTQGSASGSSDHLLILYHGKGTIVWEIVGDKILDFSFNPTKKSGTRTYIVLDRSDEYNQQGTQVIFRRGPLSKGLQDDLITLRVNKNSSFGYLSKTHIGDNTAYGAYVFDNATHGQGVFELNIKNKGAILVWPQKVDASLDINNAELSDIDSKKLGGGQATFRITNSLGTEALQAGIWVTNQNKKFGNLRFDPFLKLNVRHDTNSSNSDENYLGSFKTENQKGFVIGSNGILRIDDNSYLINVGLEKNILPSVDHIPGWQECGTSCQWIDPKHIIKQRNPSALILDQSLNEWTEKPTVKLGHQSGLFGLSGVDKSGNFKTMRQPHSFTVAPKALTNISPILDQAQNNIVFDIEGEAQFFGPYGSAGNESKIELLSLEVQPFGGYAVTNNGSQLPQRSFKKTTANEYYTYNKGAFLINGRMNLHNISLVHTDQVSTVTPRDYIASEPVYVGGETFSLLRGPVPYDMNGPLNDPQLRPKIVFNTSNFYIHTDAASTGVDFLIPNTVVDDGLCVQNVSKFIFGYNGQNKDQGVGRQLLLGTLRGACAADTINPVDANSHLDIMQINECFDIPGDVVPFTYNSLSKEYSYAPYNHVLAVQTEPNDPTVIERADITDITDQKSAHVFYLGNNSNISIGTNKDQTGFFAETTPWLRFLDDYIVVESSGGQSGDVRIATRTGQAAVFVDLNGIFSINSLIDSSFGCQIIKSRNGRVKLPTEATHFDSGVGIADWNLNFLSVTRSSTKEPAQDEYTVTPIPAPEPILVDDPVIVKSDESYPVYTIDWKTVIQNQDDFEPIKTHTLRLNKKPNISRLTTPDVIPIIEGYVQRLQIQGSLIGNVAHVKLRGKSAFVEEVSFVDTKTNSEIPSVVFILEDGATVGIGSAGQHPDSSQASTPLGRNGIIIVANTGGGNVRLNNDIVVEGHAPFYFGPDAAPSTVLRVYGDEGTSLTVRQNAVLDLRTLSTSNLETVYLPISEEQRNKSAVVGGHIVEIGGQLRVELEPNSKIVFSDGIEGLPSGILRFTDQATLNVNPYTALSDYYQQFTLGPVDNSLNPLLSANAADAHHEYAPLLDYGYGLSNTNPFRCKLIGSGILEFKDDSQAFVPYGAVLGVETLLEVIDAETQTVAEIEQTDITLRIKDAARFNIGGMDVVEGGVLQVGNVQENGAGHNIKFTIDLDGKDAYFNVGSLGVLGLNVGVAKTDITTPSDLLVDTLFNVSEISIVMNDGTFKMNRIFDTENQFGNILLIGDNGNNTPVYDLQYAQIGSTIDTGAEFRASDAFMLGGSTLAYIKKGLSNEVNNTAGLLHPIILSQDNQIQVATGPLDIPIYHQRLRGGMLASTLLQDLSANENNVTALTYFNQLKTADALAATSARNKANAGEVNEEDIAETIMVGTVANGTLQREEIADIFVGIGGSSEEARKKAVEYGAVIANIASVTGNIIGAAQLPV